MRQRPELPLFPARTVPSTAALMDEVERGRVTARDEDRLTVFTYTKAAMYEATSQGWGPVVRHARGLVFERATGELRSLTFEKFLNVGECEAMLPANLPAEPFIATEKLDGTMIGVFHDGERWRAHTKGALAGPYVEWAEEQVAKQFSAETLEPLKGLSLVFEGVYPRGLFEDELVVDHGDREELVLIAAFDVTARAEVRPEGVEAIARHMGAGVPERHVFASVDDALAAADTLDANQEGYVLQYQESGLRVKVKGARYLQVHKAMGWATPLAFWEAMDEKGRARREVLDALPVRVVDDVMPVVNRLEGEYRALMQRILTLAELARARSEGRERGIWVTTNAGPLQGGVFGVLKDRPGDAHACVMGLLRPDGNRWSARVKAALRATDPVVGQADDTEEDRRKPMWLGSEAGLTARFGAEALAICRQLHEAGHDAVIVGGPVRDALMGEAPHDVDLATSATPGQVRSLFRRTFAQGSGERHGTIGVVGPSGETYEVTTYRLDVETDGRHAEVKFTTDLAEDLQRRDFTMNALALRPLAAGAGEIIDPFGGTADIRAGVIRAVGEPARRLAEDYLRVLRAYRFQARLGFGIEDETRQALRAAAPGLGDISAERIRDELLKMGTGRRERDAVLSALLAMQEDGVFAVVLPELEATVGVTQNRYHAHDVWRHSAGAAAEAASRFGDGRLFVAALLHDIGKPVTRSVDERGQVHFYGHEEAGARLAGRILRRLAFSNQDRAWMVEAVAQHMKLLAVEPALMEGKDATGRRALGRILRDLRHLEIEDLLALRIADKAAAGVEGAAIKPEAVARVHELLGQMRETERAFRVRDLAVGGRDLMEATGRGPGPWLGELLAGLLDDVVEERVANVRDALLARAHDRLAGEREPGPARSGAAGRCA